MLGASFFLRCNLTQITAKLLIFLRQNAVKFDFLDEMSVGDHSKRFKSEDKCSGERERGRDREFAGRFIFLALIFDPNNSKIVDFLCQNAVKFDFLDEMSVGHHSKRFKSEDECSRERERGRDRDFAGRFFSLLLG